MKWSVLRIILNPIDCYFERKRNKSRHELLSDAQDEFDLIRGSLTEFDATVEYKEGDMALINGAPSTLFRNIHNRNNLEWVSKGKPPSGYIETK